ncbi:hypothetical protein [Rheinheimera texasensis]|uniref:hypothetical protein n=1 Tax=Rheinheimera texasensis TaxID=306205 RepID=UPI0032B2C899
MSQTGQPLPPDEAARQQLLQLKANSSQQLALLVQAQQQKLSEMVQQLQNQQVSMAVATATLPAVTPDSTTSGRTEHNSAALAGVLRLQQDKFGDLDLLLQRIKAASPGATAAAESLQGGEQGGEQDDRSRVI